MKKRILSILIFLALILVLIVYGQSLSLLIQLVILFLITISWILVYDSIISSNVSNKSLINETKSKIIDSGIRSLMKYVLLGKPLNDSILAILQDLKNSKLPSTEKSSALIGAFVNRLLRRELLIVILALIPTFISLYILLQQNTLISEQNMIQSGQLRVQEFAIENEKNINYQNSIKTLFDEITAIDTISSEIIQRISLESKNIEPPKFDLNTNVKLKTPVSISKTDFLLKLANCVKLKDELNQILLISDFNNSDFRQRVLANRNFKYLRAHSSNFFGSSFEFVDFFRAKLKEGVFINCWLNKSNFDEANLEGSTFAHCHLYQSSLVGTCFDNTDLRDANFFNCIFKDSKKPYLKTTFENAKVSQLDWFNYLRDGKNIGVDSIEKQYYIEDLLLEDKLGTYYLIKSKSD